MPSSRQLTLALPSSHGGRRKGAGRPNRSGLRAHTRRPRTNGREPMHVTIKLQPGLPSLRRKDMLRCLRDSVRKARRKGLAIVHYSILSNHLHLIVESRDTRSLGRAFQSLGIAFSKRINGSLARTGPVFLGRYHLHVLKSPTEVRNALKYVVSNEAVHARCTWVGFAAPVVRLDGTNSAALLDEIDWKRLFRKSFQRTGQAPPLLNGLLARPGTWLLNVGWKRACAAI